MQHSVLQTTRRSMAIIDALRRLDGAGPTRIADELDMAASTVHTHLATLEEAEYVVKEGDRYRLGLKFMDLGSHVRRSRTAARGAIPYVERLVEETDCRTAFLVEEHGRGVYFYTASGAYSQWRHTVPGNRIGLHTTAAGKSILAALPDERVREIIDRHGLARETPATITDPDVLFEELDRIRERGYAYNREEHLEGVRGIGGAATDPSGRVIGAFGIGGPAEKLTGDRFTEELPRTLLDVVSEFELEMGME